MGGEFQYPTAEITWAAGRTGWLQLEQVQGEAITKVTLIRWEVDFDILVGTITDIENTRDHVRALRSGPFTVRSYLEIDGEQILSIEGGGIYAHYAGVFLKRQVDPELLRRLRECDRLGAWTELRGEPFRRGGMIDFKPVRSYLSKFVLG